MKIVFLGTPDFAVPTLNALVEKYEIQAVICQPDRAKDRKGNPIFGAVKARAIELGLPLYQFESLRKEGVEFLKSLSPDLMITCAYGQFLSQEILDIPKYGVLNVHASILPDLRGSAPIQWSLINGYKETGVTIMKTALGMDTGDIVNVQKIEIPDEFYIEDLFEKLSQVGAQLLIDTIQPYVDGEISLIHQDESLATKCRMLTKEDANIDFSQTNYQIRNKIRGLGYGVFVYNGTPIKVYKATICTENASIKQIISLSKEGLKVGCANGSIIFTELQLPGKKRMKALDFANGVKMSGFVD